MDQLIDPSIFDTLKFFDLSDPNSENPDLALEIGELGELVSSDLSKIRSDSCSECGSDFRVLEGRLTCNGCGIVGAMADDSPGNDHAARRIVITGPQASYYTRDLDRSSSVDYSAKQYTTVLNELQYRNQRYANPFPEAALQRAAEIMNSIQRKDVILRSDKKKQVMGFCVYLACLGLGFHRKNEEIAEMLDLKRSISQGGEILSKLNSEHKLHINLEINPIKPMATSTVEMLSTKMVNAGNVPNSGALSAKQKERVIDLVVDIVATAEENCVGTNSKQLSKINASAFIAIRELTDAPITRELVSSACSISVNTIDKFLHTFDQYQKSIFKPVVDRHRVVN
jgi:transcription initiation factor TFIIIB Brf1 subunit/transcription initiation factor TFIIB